MIQKYIAQLKSNEFGNLYIYKSLTDSQIHELLYFANNDPLVIKFTSDKTRFLNKDVFSKWAIDKEVYSLSDETRSFFGGIIWIEKKPIPERAELDQEKYSLTTALRVYGKLRGQHLSVPFVVAVLKQYLKENNTNSNFWLETSFDNFALQKVFEKLGFLKVAEADERGKIVMISPENLVEVLQKLS